MMCFGEFPSCCLCLGFVEILVSMGLQFSSNLEKTSAIISLKICLVPFPLWDSSYSYSTLLEVVSQLTDILFLLGGFFSLCFILYNLYCCAFKFSTFSNVKSAVNPIQYIFHLHYLKKFDLGLLYVSA